jgi:hypothetical protein
MNDYVRLAREMVERVSYVYGAVEFLRPVPVGFALPRWAAPSLALGALLSLAVLSGIAIVSLGAAVTALLVAALILDQIFGVVVEPR